MYKSFTFDALNQQLFNDKKYEEKKRQIKKTCEYPRKNEKFLPPDRMAKQVPRKNNYSGWKNGIWDLKNPLSFTQSDINLTTSALGTAGKPSEVNKYLPLSKKGRIFQNLGFGKTDLKRVLGYGIDRPPIKRLIK